VKTEPRDADFFFSIHIGNIILLI